MLLHNIFFYFSLSDSFSCLLKRKVGHKEIKTQLQTKKSTIEKNFKWDILLRTWKTIKTKVKGKVYLSKFK